MKELFINIICFIVGWIIGFAMLLHYLYATDKIKDEGGDSYY